MAVLLCGISLFRKYLRERSVPYLLASLIFLLQAFGIISIVFDSLSGSQISQPFENIFQTDHILAGFAPLFALTSYIIEIKRPGSITVRNVAFGILPIAVVSAVIFMFPEWSCNYKTIDEFVSNIAKPGVWIRLVLAAFYFIYPVLAMCLPYDWRKCMVSRRIITAMLVLFLFLSPAVMLGLMLGFFQAVVINYLLLVAIDVFIAIIEFRIRIPSGKLQSYKEEGMEKNELLFDDPHIWMNPDMTAVELSRIMGTNRTYLLEKIKSLGYSGYTDMVNHKRVKYICDKLDKGDNVGITKLFYEAGFRSRSTATSEFRRIVGCSPSEYASTKRIL